MGFIQYQKSAQCSYKEYIEWFHNLDKQEGLEYWKKVLEGFDSQSAIQSTKKPISEKKQMDIVAKRLSKDVTKDLLDLASNLQVTMNTIAESTWGIFLQKMNDSTDVIFGKVVSGRNIPLTGVHSKVGLFINTIPVRVMVDEKISIKELLKQVYEKDVESSNYEYCGLADIQRLSPLGPKLFNTIIVFENYLDRHKFAKEIVNKYKIEMSEGREQTNYPISIRFSVVEDSLEFCLLYNPNEYNKDEIVIICNRLEIIFKTIAYQPELQVCEVDMITKKEYDIIYHKFNNTDVDYDKTKTIVDLFEEQVKKTPNNIALVYNQESLTYEVMNRKVNVVANKLRSIGVKKNEFVGIIAKQSLEAIICIYGILKSGAAYVPIDSNYPINRIKYILEDATPKVLLVDEENENYGVECLNIKKKDFWKGIEENPLKINKTDDLAYCIYTSGTTGAPKGVLICHQGIPNLRNHFINTIGVNEKDSILQFASIVFDASVWEMTMALLTGAKLVIPTESERINHEKFLKLASLEKISIATLPPIFFQSLNKFKPRILITAGSESSREIVNKAVKHSIYINAYGPSEFTVCTTQWNYTREWELQTKIPIGKPICNSKVFILNGVKMCGIGVPGELCMSGIGMAKGYLNKENLTKQKFIDNPFGQGKLYRSGDLARWLPDGNIEYLGRIDQQVKIRGFRIELGEIEGMILQYHDIKEAVVIGKQDQTGEKVLVGYFVSSIEINITKLKQHLKNNLPDYMIPQHLIQIERIPTTINGKLDKKKLPDSIPQNEINYIAPRNDIEEKLCHGFQTILNIEKIGIDDDFFELGGNSIKAMKLAAYLKKYGFNISISNILKSASVRLLYKECFEEKEVILNSNYEFEIKEISDFSQFICYIEKYNKKLNAILAVQNIEKEYPMSAMQRYSLDHNILHSGTVIDLDYKVEPIKLERVLKRMINGDGAFRSVLVRRKEDIYICEYSEIDTYKMLAIDLSYQSQEMKSNIHQKLLDKIYGSTTWQKINIFNRLLYEIIVIKFAENNWKIYIPFCHVLFDGMSADILQNKILSLYYNNAYKDEKHSSFYKYMKILWKGPENISCNKCMKVFDLERFNVNIKRQSKISLSQFENVIIKLDFLGSFHEENTERLWNLAYRLYNNILYFNFNLKEISSVILISSRKMKQFNFHDSIGQFLDLLPITDREKNILDYDKIEHLLEVIREHHLSFSEFMYSSTISEEYEKIKKIFNSITLDKIQIPVFNFVGFFHSIIDEEQLHIDENTLSTIVDVYSTDSKIYIKTFCKKDRLDNLKNQLQEEINRTIINFER